MSMCAACNGFLTDHEAIRKHAVTKEEIGLCDTCLDEVLAIQYIPIISSADDIVGEIEVLGVDEILDGESFYDELYHPEEDE